MGDLLQKVVEGISGNMAPDPNNPFPTPPPNFIEYPLAFLGGIGQHPQAGPVTRGLSGLAGFTGQEIAKRRTDPFQRALAASQAGIEAAKGITVPVPGQTLSVGGPVPTTSPPGLFQARPPTEFPEEPPQFDTPTTARPVRTMTELLANARSPQDSRMIMAGRLMGVPEDTFFTKPPQVHFATPGSVPADPFTGKTVGDQIPAKPKIETRMRPIQQPGEPFATMQAEFQEVTNPLTGEVLSRTEVPGTRALIHRPVKPENPLDNQLKQQRLADMKRGEDKIKRLEEGRLTPREAVSEVQRWEGIKSRALHNAQRAESEEAAANESAMATYADSMIKQLLPTASKVGKTDTTTEAPVMPGAGGKALNDATAIQILKEAGGDKTKARALAKQRGYSISQ